MHEDGRYETVDLGRGIVVSAWPVVADRIRAIWRVIQEEDRGWIAKLEALGVRAAHPDDGWVNRVENKVHLCYPQFGCVRDLEVGDLIALGSHSPLLVGPHSRGTRIVRVTGFSTGGQLSEGIVADWDRYYVHFEEVS